MRETVVEKRFCKAVKDHGGRAVKWSSPGNRGVPDRIVLLPNGRTVYVELKAPGKPLAPLQAKWAVDLRNMGHMVYKIDCHADTDSFIAEVFG
jgi:ribosomal protein S6